MTTPLAPLRPWSRTWRYLVAVAVGAVAWIGYAAALGAGSPDAAQRDRIVAALALDLAVGAAAITLLSLRRRAPLAVACLTTAAAAFSVAGLGAMVVAVVSMATWRRRWWAAAVGGTAVAGGIVSAGFYRPLFSPAGHSAGQVAANAVVIGLITAIAVASGFYIGERRELLASLRQRAIAAEREQILSAQAVRAAERTRIAREMHDDLAHRISLVALHAGALVFREDLSRAETAATAQTIQANAQLALTELRQVLGVLRDGDPGLVAQRSQPTLAELPALIADAREAGSVIRFDASGLPGAVPEALSRTSFRVVQEALTNARKHAPGEPVGVRLTGARGDRLGIEVRNPVGAPAAVPLPSAGVGLAGLGERAALAGGTLDFGEESGDFVVRASLPWPA
ncbi:signal transduction histidine kinase [Allocatelliglobosispora scoriae]|uniref:histidine kinase n=1 Tax=Allocatelliglobosispora scoriae TaxID=643052 RepID=A0A841BJN5_9ACTN|nr:histidine kinase [Allocatelliglobosispora scoriae]MBB5867111.1 signal transduction histidine kinase [Allocatelliglobosispora scoriae]